MHEAWSKDPKGKIKLSTSIKATYPNTIPQAEYGKSDVYVDLPCVEKEALKVYLGLEINDLKVRDTLFPLIW